MDDWERLAALKPRLRPHAKIYRHQYRGQPWYVLADELTASNFHLSLAVYRFISLLDGSRSIAAAYEQLGTGEGQPSKQEVAVLLGRLRNADLLQGDFPTTTDDLQSRQQLASRAQKLRRFIQPLMQRFALVDPDAWLAQRVHWVKPLFSPAGFMGWLLIVAWALMQAGSHSTELAYHWATRFSDPLNLLLLWALYPLVKVIHELAHGFATRLWGGQVHEMGIMLLVFMPMPYVDASASSSFYSKRRRMVVAAAGIMAEVWLAAVALLLWLYLDDGLLKDACFNIAVIGGISTVLFNGNPLLRFDGYYILMDWLEIPNLGSRSNQYLGYLCKRYLFGLGAVASPVRDPGERRWFVAYGLGSGFYRLFISLAIALYVAQLFFFLGVILAVWALVGQWVLPAWKNAVQLLAQARMEQQTRRLYAVTGGSALVLFLAFFVIPVTNSSYAQGVINLPEQSVIRARTDGFITSVNVEDGESVTQDQLLFELSNPDLAARRELLQAQVDEHALRRQQVMISDPLEAQQHEAAGQLAEEELRDVQVRMDGLQLLSPTAGVAAVTRGGDLPGRYVEQGEILAHVVDRTALTARIVVEQADAEQVRHDTREVELLLPGLPGQSYTANMLREVPQATTRLPSAALGTRGGGRIAVDARDEEGLQALDRVFQFELLLPPLPGTDVLYHRVNARFIHRRQPLALQWLDNLRRFIVKKLQK